MKQIKLINIIVFLSFCFFILTIGCNQSAKENKQLEENNSALQNKQVQASSSKADIEFLTKETFKQKIVDFGKTKEYHYNGELPSIVEFYATWCGPCKMLAPILEELSHEYSGKIKIYKVDVDKEMELSNAFGINSIPAIYFFPKTGHPVRTEGFIPKNELSKAIQQVLLKTDSTHAQKREI